MGRPLVKRSHPQTNKSEQTTGRGKAWFGQFSDIRVTRNFRLVGGCFGRLDPILFDQGDLGSGALGLHLMWEGFL